QKRLEAYQLQLGDGVDACPRERRLLHNSTVVGCQFDPDFLHLQAHRRRIRPLQTAHASICCIQHCLFHSASRHDAGAL
ncbi:hypothetical protein ANCDUO_10646, partial [Ancylostoma duodenale]